MFPFINTIYASDPMEFYILILACIGSGLFIATMFWIWFFPKPAKTLALAHRKKQDVLFLATDVGNIELHRGKNFESGQIEVKGKHGLTKMYMAPSPSSEPYVTKRFGAKGMNGSWWFGHVAYPQLSNPLFLLLIYINRIRTLFKDEIPERLSKKVFKPLESYEASFLSKEGLTDEKGKLVTDGEGNVVTIETIKRKSVILLSPAQLQDVADRPWEMSTIIAQCRRHEWIGERKAQRSIMLIVLLIVFVALCILGGIFFMVMGGA